MRGKSGKHHQVHDNGHRKEHAVDGATARGQELSGQVAARCDTAYSATGHDLQGPEGSAWGQRG